MSYEVEPTAVRYRRIFSVLSSISNTIAQGVGLDALIGLIARETLGLVRADSCSIMLFDEARAELLCRAACGLSPEEMRLITFRVGEGVAGWVAQHGEAARIEDVLVDSRFVHKPGQSRSIRSLLCVPLRVRETVVGVVTVTRALPEPFTGEDQEILSFLANAVVLDVENARLYRLSVTDPLTKACNRQYLREKLPDEIERARRFRQPVTVVMFDVDHFKRLNDTFGHAAGDEVLREIALLARETVRDVDTVARYGGEEFVLILPNTNAQGGRQIAERLREAIARTPFGHETRLLQVTASFGVAELTGEVREEGDLLRRADEALYEAKRRGRNRTELYGASGEKIS
jgi:diguanylate cyclase (GGDEF)-like protein